MFWHIILWFVCKYKCMPEQLVGHCSSIISHRTHNSRITLQIHINVRNAMGNSGVDRIQPSLPCGDASRLV